MSELGALDAASRCESNCHELECYEIVDLITNINSPEGPYNQSESAQISEPEMQLAYEHQLRITDRIECLVRVVAQSSAASETEIAAKTRALKALRAVDFWDQESLQQLEVSIESDWDHLSSAGCKAASVQSVRQGWLTRQLGGYYARTVR